MLVVKNHLKGKIPDMLNAKDNHVFLDYLAGGQNRRIAVERAANAQSTGLLSMGARNVCGVEDMTIDAHATIITEEQLALIKEARQELETVQVLAVAVKEGRQDLEAVKSLMSEVSQMQGLSETFQGVKQGFSELADVKMTCAKKEQEQKLSFAEEFKAFDLRKIEDLQALELKKLAFELKKLEDFQAFDVRKRKQNLEMDEEEAHVAERCKAIREGRRVLQQQQSEEEEEEEDDDEILPAAEDSENGEMSLYASKMVYNESAEVGMDEGEVQQRRLLWKRLDVVCKDDPSEWRTLAQELGIATQTVLEFDKQCHERCTRYLDIKVGWGCFMMLACVQFINLLFVPSLMTCAVPSKTSH